jgi:hypothetical protein
VSCRHICPLRHGCKAACPLTPLEDQQRAAKARMSNHQHRICHYVAKVAAGDAGLIENRVIRDAAQVTNDLILADVIGGKPFLRHYGFAKTQARQAKKPLDLAKLTLTPQWVEREIRRRGLTSPETAAYGMASEEA